MRTPGSSSTISGQIAGKAAKIQIRNATPKSSTTPVITKPYDRKAFNCPPQ
jgi:hypothetical protein